MQTVAMCLCQKRSQCRLVELFNVLYVLCFFFCVMKLFVPFILLVFMIFFFERIIQISAQQKRIPIKLDNYNFFFF